MSISQFPNNLFSIVPIGNHVANSVLTTAVTITVPNNASGVMIQASGQRVRYTIGSVVPTSAVGFALSPTEQPIRLDLFPGAIVRVIEEAVGGAVNYHFFRSV